MDPPKSGQRRYARVTRSAVKKEGKKPTEETATEQALKDRLRARAVVRIEKLDFGEGSGSDESHSSTETEVMGGVGSYGSRAQWFPESTEPVRRRSRGRPPKRLNNARTPARQEIRKRNEPSGSGSCERLSLGESSSSSTSRRISGVKRKSESMSAEYEIEDILDKYVDRDGNIWYLILWKNYEKFESTWEPRGRVEPDGMEAIHDFENRVQQALVLQEEARGEDDVATRDIGDNAGSSASSPPPRRRSQPRTFRNVLLQTGIDFMCGVITSAFTLIGMMTVLAYSYALYFSQEDD